MRRALSIILILSLAQFILLASAADASSEGIVFSTNISGVGPARAVTVNSSGDIIVVGEGNGASILTYNSSGSLLSARTVGLADGRAITVIASGETYVTGAIYSPGKGPNVWDLPLLKFSSSESIEWQTAWYASNTVYNEGLAVTTDSSGNVYVGGYTESSTTYYADALIQKYDSSGNLIWSRTWGGSRDESIVGLVADSAGNLYATGTTSSVGNGRATFLLKYNSAGTLLWQRLWKSSGSTDANAITIDSAGLLYLTGDIIDSSYSTQTFLVVVNANGQMLWQRLWKGPGDSSGQAVAVNSTGSIFVTGYASNPHHVLLLTFSHTGNLTAEYLWGGHGDDQGVGIAVVPSGGVVIAGNAGGPPYALTSISYTAQTGSLTESTPSLATTTISGSKYNPTKSVSNLTVSKVMCSPSNVFLLEYGPPPLAPIPTTYSVAFTATGGSIQFCGNSYYNGDSNSFPTGNYTADARVSYPPVYSASPTNCSYPIGNPFLYWNSTGGVTVSNKTSNPTNVTITGPGSLVAVFHVSCYEGSIPPLPVAASLILVAMSLLHKTRGKRLKRVNFRHLFSIRGLWKFYSLSL